MAHSTFKYRGEYSQIGDLAAEIILRHIIRLIRAQEPVDPALEAFAGHCEQELIVSGSGTPMQS